MVRVALVVAVSMMMAACVADVEPPELGAHDAGGDAGPECMCRSCLGPVANLGGGKVECIRETYDIYPCACPGDYATDH